jgi:hypothetical protein
MDELDRNDGRWRETARWHASVLLDPDADFGSQREAAMALFSLLSASIGLDDENPGADDVRESPLLAGVAIAPRDAARCVQDFARTRKFLCGMRAAITAARRRFANQTVRVLYAGCGPFAILALPIAHEWAPGEVCFTLLDYHARSLDAARHLACRLGVLDRISAFVQVDASRYRCPQEALPHVLVTETMQRALEKEPQVAVTRHLAPQLMPGGILVPERIELHATLMDRNKEFAFDSDTLARERIELGCVMTLDTDGDRCANAVWPDAVPERMEPFIRTQIRISGDISLGDYESGLTIPAHLPLDRRPQPGQQLRFDYRLEPRPGLVCSVDARQG